jgi:hypothetical protein
MFLRQTLGNGNMNTVESPRERPFFTSSEERLQKLSRYRNKKAKRNFGRKIKVALKCYLHDLKSLSQLLKRFKTCDYKLLN